MPPVPDWTQQFRLTNPYTTAQGDDWLYFNTQTASGIYLLDQKACAVNFDVRSTKLDVPQGDGAILPERFLTGAVADLSVQLWENSNVPACDELLQAMLDDLTGAVRSLLNAGDNEGRLSWTLPDNTDRMVDDARLLTYPRFTMDGPTPVVVFTLDSQYPYAVTEADTYTNCLDGIETTITNGGTADYYGVFQVNRTRVGSSWVVGGTAVHSFTIQNLTTGLDFNFDDTLASAPEISANHFGEIDCFRNTMYEMDVAADPGTDLTPSIIQTDSEYFQLVMGENRIKITGADMAVIHADAWG